MNEEHREPTQEEWKQATWDFILEHCDILERGGMFVKFHMSGRADLEKRIRARAVYNYHREDVRAKEALQCGRRNTHTTTKKQKNEVWRANREERRRVFDELKQRNEENIKNRPWWKKIL